MRLAAAIAALILIAIAAPFFFGGSKEEAARRQSGLPWQIEIQADGSSKVFGLVLGRSTLAEAAALWGPDGQLAVIASAGQPAGLEAYYESVTAGFVTGRLILSAELSQEALTGIRERAVKIEPTPSGARRYQPGGDDKRLALQAPVRAISFIPSANLDEPTVLQRFGTPAQRVRSGAQTEHFLYPQQGLDLLLDTEGKELLQYVAPRDFVRLSAPLQAAVAPPAANR